ncbi:MAG: hydroxymethylpyrimidine/phosphomethylpyrimidine kinase [Chrysiogenetes bacterium]|nr:hydroxymethylpyrimidine/phosphomethylpyrimidine kinase [Chrysiogenetes bacterium]
MAKRNRQVLIVSALDPSGGAGLLLDRAVVEAEGAHACGVVTALTVQSASGLVRTRKVPAELVMEQIATLEADLGPFEVAKLGALGSPALAHALTGWAAKRPRLRLVIDPVSRPSRGRPSLVEGSVRTHRKALRGLLTHTYLLTPNLPEARWLLGLREDSAAAPEELATRLLELGPRAVLLKGGHAAGAQVADLLAEQSGKRRLLTHPRKRGEFHGTGCYLASAITANLSLGKSLTSALEHASASLERAMKNARPVGAAGVRQLRPATK